MRCPRGSSLLNSQLTFLCQVTSVTHLGIGVYQTVSLAAQSPKLEDEILPSHWPCSTDSGVLLFDGSMSATDGALREMTRFTKMYMGQVNRKKE